MDSCVDLRLWRIQYVPFAVYLGGSQPRRNRMTAEAVSRRKVLKAGAGAAAVGVLGASVAPALLGSSPSASPTSSPQGQAVMVRLRSEASGVLDLFVGTERLEIHDAALAARIAAAARPLF
jgi:hypothetical protein